MNVSELLASSDIETVRLGLSLVDPEFYEIRNKDLSLLQNLSLRVICEYPKKVLRYTLTDYSHYSNNHLESISFLQCVNKPRKVGFGDFPPISQTILVQLYEQFEDSRASKFYRYRKLFARIKSYFQRKVQQLV